MKAKAVLIHLGCAKNLVDSETIIPQLLTAGYEIADNTAMAELIVVNTCGFLESAVEEAIQTILEVAQYKHTGACQTLLVIGCMVQRYGRKLLSLLPEVNLFAGTSHYHRVREILREHQSGNQQRLWIARPEHLQTSDHPRQRSTPSHTAYLKIAEGCSNHCTFCFIPKLRGPYRSRSMADVVQEAKRMAAEGVREVNVIAQDITGFATDRGEIAGLERLLEALESIQGLDWIRLLYAYPGRISSRLLQVMAHSGKIVPYLDFPIQHCVPHLLRAMHRGAHQCDMESLIGQIRAEVPGIALRTSIMVGFPGETEDDFEVLLTFVERMRFEHLGVFAYSPEEGTAAARFPQQVSDEVKICRYERLLNLQRNISRQRLDRLCGSVVPVLVEGFHPETELLLCGRMPTQAPEVDGMVLINRGTGTPGTIMPVMITDAQDYDLIGELIEEAPASPQSGRHKGGVAEL